MPASPSKEEQLPQATFIFKGTVKKLKAATMKSVPVDNQTHVVTVDQVIEAPKNLASYAGKDITVQLSGRQKVKVGQEMVFRTNGWIFGDSVAVQSVAQEPVKKTHAAMLGRGGDPVQNKAARDLRERFDDADVVVSGKVAAIRLPSGGGQAETRRTRTAAAAAELSTGRPISEHDPKWREAVIEIDSVHKGNHPKKTAVVRFAASTDVRWYKAPKFHPGQQGYFMLHKTKAAEGEPKRAAGRAAAAAEPEGAEAYTCLHPADFQPYAQPGGVKTLIE